MNPILNGREERKFRMFSWFNVGEEYDVIVRDFQNAQEVKVKDGWNSYLLMTFEAVRDDELLRVGKGELFDVHFPLVCFRDEMLFYSKAVGDPITSWDASRKIDFKLTFRKIRKGKKYRVEIINLRRI